MRDAEHGGQGRGWRRFDPKALAGLTDQQIRDMAKAWLDRTLAEDWESWLLREHRPLGPEELRDTLTSLYVEDMEALESRRYGRVEGDVARVLEEGLIPQQPASGQGQTQAQPTGGSTTNQGEGLERQARLQYLKLCDAMLRARAAALEASSAPGFAGRLVPNPNLNISMARELLEAWYGPLLGGPGLVPMPLQAGMAGLVGQAIPAPARVQDGPRLSEAVDKYLEVKGPTWKPSSRKDIPPHIWQFVDIMRKAVANGGDVPITSLTRDHIRGYCTVMQALPNRFAKAPEYKNKSYAKLVKLNLPEDQRLSPQTLTNRFTNIRSFLNWASEEYGIDAGRLNSAFIMPQGVKSRGQRSTSTRDHFTLQELTKLFDPAKYLEATAKHPSRFWVPLIALFTGMRASEICRLHLDELRQASDEEFIMPVGQGRPGQAPPERVWVFDISNRGSGDRPKTEAGERLVPVHPFLVECLGLLEYAQWTRQQKPGQVQLFPEIIPNVKHDMGHTVGQWFTRYRRALEIGGQEGQKSSKVFHSFRHTVIHYLTRTAMVAPQLVQAVVGHEEKGADIGVTAIYAGNYPAHVLRDEVIMRLPWVEALPRLGELATSPWALQGLKGRTLDNGPGETTA